MNPDQQNNTVYNSQHPYGGYAGISNYNNPYLTSNQLGINRSNIDEVQKFMMSLHNKVEDLEIRTKEKMDGLEKEYKESLENQKKEFQNNINDSLKVSEEKSNNKLNEKENKTVEILAIFITLFTFISVNVNIFTRTSDIRTAIIFMILMTLCSIIIASTLLFFIKNPSDVKDIKKNWVLFLGLLIPIVTLIIGIIFVLNDKYNFKLNLLNSDNQQVDLDINPIQKEKFILKEDSKVKK